MTDRRSIRFRKIESLLQDLKYEVMLGVFEGSIPEELTFQFIVPVSRTIEGGEVHCSFRAEARERPRAERVRPSLKLVVDNAEKAVDSAGPM